jgi:predicted transcriptional regulator
MSPDARGLLAIHEKTKGRFKKAAKHLVINANLGQDLALKYVKTLFVQGVVSKEEYTAALRGYQAAVKATKSVEREAAEEAMKNGR